MTDVRTITVSVGGEYKTTFTNIYKKDEFLYPEYCQAARCIDEIVSASIQYDNRHNSSQYKHRMSDYERSAASNGFGPTDEQFLRGYPNNIIAFCARRGQGKTSCMLSVSKALSLLPVNNWDQYVDPEIIRQFWANAHRIPGRMDSDTNSSPEASVALVSGQRFFVIDPIDPSSMEHGDSLLRTIFLRMEQTVREHLEKPDRQNSMAGQRDEYSNQLRQLRDKFGDTYRKLLALKSTPNQSHDVVYDDLTQLEQSGDSVILRRSIMELFKTFLDFMGYDMLVIQIDDADLNSVRAYEITEDIRNYCVGPHVVVLMALHLGTLRNCIEQEYVRRYEYLLRTDLDITHMEHDKCRETAERYIDKLLPGRHQIHLPYLKDYIRDGASNVGLRYFSTTEGYGNGAESVRYSPGEIKAKDLQASMMNLVFRKTGVVLMPRADYYHSFMPSRFRELTHMLPFFHGLEDVIPSGPDEKQLPDEMLQEIIISYALFDPRREETEYTQEQIRYLDRRIYNLKQMELYLIQHWANMTLSKRQWTILHEASEVPDSILFRKTMIKLQQYLLDTNITDELPSNLYPGFGSGRSLAESSSPSLAAVKKTLRSVDWNLDFANKYDLTYCLRLLFSIRLHLNAMNQLRYHNSLDSLAKMCGNEVFYDDPLNLDGRQLISVDLLRHMEPSFENVNLGWSDYYEALTSADNHGTLLLESTVTKVTEDLWQINPKAAWLRPSFNYALFRSISDDVMKGQRRTEYQSRTEQQNRGKEAFDGAADLLMLICNYDMQHRLSSALSKISEFESSVYYGESAMKLADFMSSLFSVERHATEPQQYLPLGCNYSTALFWSYNSEPGQLPSQYGREGKLSLALELANPIVCIRRAEELLRELLDKLQPESDEEHYRDLMDNYRLEYRDTIDCMVTIPAMRKLMRRISDIIKSPDYSQRASNRDWLQRCLTELEKLSKSTDELELTESASHLEKAMLDQGTIKVSSKTPSPKTSPQNPPISPTKKARKRASRSKRR